MFVTISPYRNIYSTRQCSQFGVPSHTLSYRGAVLSGAHSAIMKADNNKSIMVCNINIRSGYHCRADLAMHLVTVEQIILVLVTITITIPTMIEIHGRNHSQLCWSTNQHKPRQHLCCFRIRTWVRKRVGRGQFCEYRGTNNPMHGMWNCAEIIMIAK